MKDVDVLRLLRHGTQPTQIMVGPSIASWLVGASSPSKSSRVMCIVNDPHDYCITSYPLVPTQSTRSSLRLPREF